MVFKKNCDDQIIKCFEQEILKKVSKSYIFDVLKSELQKRNFDYKIHVQCDETNKEKYCSYMVIDIFDQAGKRVIEVDEPNCCLMVCETLCFVRCGNIVGIDLCIDENFIQSVELLIEGIKKYTL